MEWNGKMNKELNSVKPDVVMCHVKIPYILCAWDTLKAESGLIPCFGYVYEHTIAFQLKHTQQFMKREAIKQAVNNANTHLSYRYNPYTYYWFVNPIKQITVEIIED